MWWGFSPSGSRSTPVTPENCSSRRGDPPGAVDHFALTHYIRKNTPLAERIDIVKTMGGWSTATASSPTTRATWSASLADLLGLDIGDDRRQVGRARRLGRS